MSDEDDFVNRTFNVREWHIQRFKSEGLNRSAIVRSLLDEYFEGGRSAGAEDAVRRMRISQIETEMRMYEDQRDRLEAELSTLKESISDADDEYFAELDDILDAMEGRMKVDADLPRIRTLAASRYGASDRGDAVIGDLRERAEEQGRDIGADHWR